MTFKASYMDHRRNISCTAKYPRKTSNDSTVETTVMLRVLFPPKETHITIDPSASVSVGTNVPLTCKSKAGPSNDMNYTWYKCGQEMPVAWRKKISFIVTHNKTGLYFCIAQNIYGSQSSAEIQLTDEGESCQKHTPSVTGAASHFGGFILWRSYLKAAYIIKDVLFRKGNHNKID